MNVEATVYNQSGEVVGKAALPLEVFGRKWNADLVHQVVTSQAANRRRGTAHAKTRGEISGGGKKPWRQKGTGRARHGSIRSPIWVGGGVAHGPRSTKVYAKKVNKKMAALALSMVLSAKARDRELIVIDSLDFAEPKTRHAAKLFKGLAAHEEFAKTRKENSVLVAVSGGDTNVRRALNNLPNTAVDALGNLTAYDVLRYKYILFPRLAITSFIPAKRAGRVTKEAAA